MSSTAEVMSVTTKTTKADLEREVRRLAALANDNHNELESFKNRVYEVALEQKEDNDWCDEGFAEAMSELGIKIPSRYKRVTIVVDFDLTDTDGPTAYESDYLDDASDEEIADAVIEALGSYAPGYEGHTVKVETLEETPEKLFREKQRRTGWGY